jgi:hypothetical protein
MISQKEKDTIIQMVFVISIAIIGVLAFVQGRWEGMRTICPEPFIIGRNRTGGIECISEELYSESIKSQPMPNISLGGFYDT